MNFELTFRIQMQTWRWQQENLSEELDAQKEDLKTPPLKCFGPEMEVIMYYFRFKRVW